MFVAGLEADVAEAGAVGGDSGEDVLEHVGVDFAVFYLGRTGRPGGVENMGDVGEGGELGVGILGV